MGKPSVLAASCKPAKDAIHGRERERGKSYVARNRNRFPATRSGRLNCPVRPRAHARALRLVFTSPRTYWRMRVPSRSGYVGPMQKSVCACGYLKKSRQNVVGLTLSHKLFFFVEKRPCDTNTMDYGTRAGTLQFRLLSPG